MDIGGHTEPTHQGLTERLEGIVMTAMVNIGGKGTEVVLMPDVGD